MSTIITRIKRILIGKSENLEDCYEWFGIKSTNWSDVTPWEHIEIPSGPMLHQHLHSPHIKGEIRCHDLNALYQALFNTEINGNGKTAVNSNTMVKTNVEYLQIDMINESNNVVSVFLDGFKVETIGVESIELGGEALWIVRFTADRVVYGMN
jgi:hypothetical protein